MVSRAAEWCVNITSGEILLSGCENKSNYDLSRLHMKKLWISG